MTNYQYRDAQTGEFVTQEYAEAHPDVTVREETHEAKYCAHCEAKIIFDSTVSPDLLALEAENSRLRAAEFWSNWVYPEGATPEDIQNELADYKFVMEQVCEVYYTLTNGRLSKPNYDAATIISEVEEIRQQEISDAFKEAAFEPCPDLLALQARVSQLEAALESYAHRGNWCHGDNDTFDTWHEDHGPEIAEQALVQPTPDTSPLWELLKLNLALEQGEGDKAWAKAMNALTPEIRALIAEMAGRGE